MRLETETMLGETFLLSERMPCSSSRANSAGARLNSSARDQLGTLCLMKQVSGVCCAYSAHGTDFVSNLICAALRDFQPSRRTAEKNDRGVWLILAEHDDFSDSVVALNRFESLPCWTTPYAYLDDGSGQRISGTKRRMSSHDSAADSPID